MLAFPSPIVPGMRFVQCGTLGTAGLGMRTGAGPAETHLPGAVPSVQAAGCCGAKPRAQPGTMNAISPSAAARRLPGSTWNPEPGNSPTRDPACCGETGGEHGRTAGRLLQFLPERAAHRFCPYFTGRGERTRTHPRRGAANIARRNGHLGRALGLSFCICEMGARDRASRK